MTQLENFVFGRFRGLMSDSELNQQTKRSESQQNKPVAQGLPPFRETKGQRRVAQLLWYKLWERLLCCMLGNGCMSIS